jgi:hypothetical protein
MASSVQPREQRLDRVEHDALGADRIDGVPSRTNRPSRSYSPLSSISARSIRTWSMTSFLRGDQPSTSKPSEATLVSRSSLALLEAHEHAGLAELGAPLTRKVMANSVLPQPAAPHSSVGRPVGRPPKVSSSRADVGFSPRRNARRRRRRSRA